jgi:hypothetical protein
MHYSHDSSSQMLIWTIGCMLTSGRISNTFTFQMDSVFRRYILFPNEIMLTPLLAGYCANGLLSSGLKGQVFHNRLVRSEIDRAPARIQPV